MKINSSLVNGIILLLISGLGTIFLYLFDTGQETKEQTLIVKENFVSISHQLDNFTELQKEQNSNMTQLHKRMDAISDSIVVQNLRTKQDLATMTAAINQIIYIEKKTNTEFKEIYNVLNLAERNQ